MAMQSRNRYKPYQVANEKPPEGWPTTPCPYINEGIRGCRPYSIGANGQGRTIWRCSTHAATFVALPDGTLPPGTQDRLFPLPPLRH